MKVVEKMADHSPFAVPAELQVCLYQRIYCTEAVRHERDVSNAGR